MDERTVILAEKVILNLIKQINISLEIVRIRFELFVENVVVVDRAGLVRPDQLKLIEKRSQERSLRGEVSRVESYSRERKLLDIPRLDGGGDVLGLPVLDCLDQEQRGGDKSHGYEDSPDEPGAPELGLVDVFEPVDTGGGEEIIQLLEQSPGFVFNFSGHQHVQYPRYY